MGNKKIVDKINRRLFTERDPSILEQALTIFAVCYIAAFLAGYFVGMP